MQLSIFGFIFYIWLAFIGGGAIFKKLNEIEKAKREEKKETTKTVQSGLDEIRKRFRKQCEEARDGMIDALKQGKNEIVACFSMARLTINDVRYLYDIMDAHPDLRELGVRVMCGKEPNQEWFKSEVTLRITQIKYDTNDRDKNGDSQKDLTAGENLDQIDRPDSKSTQKCANCGHQSH